MLRYILTCLFFLFTTSYLSADTKEKMDSLLKTVAHLDDSSKIAQLVNITSSSDFISKDYDLTLALLDKAMDIAIKRNFLSMQYQINKIKGRVYINKSDYSNANKILTSTLSQIPKGDTFLLHKCDIYNYLGLLHRNLGNYDLAIKNFYQSLEFAEKLKKGDQIAVCYTNIGGVYYFQDNYKEAIASFEKARVYRIKENDSANVAGLENNMGALYLEKNNYKDALKKFKNAYTYFESIKHQRYQALILNNIARSYIGLKQYSEAMSNLDLALIYAQKSENKSAIINSNYLIGDVYQAQKKYLDALPYYKKGLDLAKENHLKPLIRDIYKRLAETEYLVKNYNDAYLYHTLYATYQDSIVNENTNKQITEIQEKYESEKKEKEIESLSKEKLLQEVEINKKEIELNTQKNIRNYSFIGIGILLLSFSLLYFNYSTKKKGAQILEEKNKEIEIKNKDITDSIKYASRIQNAILPSMSDIKNCFLESFVLYKPKDIVAGDFYWMEQKGNSIFIAAADCTGHGVPGAMVSVVCSNAINRAVNEFNNTQPAIILNKTRELVIESFSKSGEDVNDGMDISLCAFVKSSNELYTELQWAGANNPLWIIRPSNSEAFLNKNNNLPEQNNGINFSFIEVLPNKQPIGNFITNIPFTNHNIKIYKGDTIYIFTDGYADQFGGEKGKKLKTANVKNFLLSIQHENMNNQHTMLIEAFEKWRGPFEQVDDVCVIGVRV